MHTLQGLSKEKVQEDRYKIDHLQLESWQMEIINHAVEEAEQEAIKIVFRDGNASLHRLCEDGLKESAKECIDIFAEYFRQSNQFADFNVHAVCISVYVWNERQTYAAGKREDDVQ